MAADVTGNTSGNVSGTYNPTVTITGVSLIVDGTTYTKGDVTITPDSTVTLTVTGTNLQYGTNDNFLDFARGAPTALCCGTCPLWLRSLFPSRTRTAP